jgi:hypothetical protein
MQSELALSLAMKVEPGNMIVKEAGRFRKLAAQRK